MIGYYYISFCLDKEKLNLRDVKWVFQHHLANKIQTLGYVNLKSSCFLQTQAVSMKAVLYSKKVSYKKCDLSVVCDLARDGRENKKRLFQFI